MARYVRRSVRLFSVPHVRRSLFASCAVVSQQVHIVICVSGWLAANAFQRDRSVDLALTSVTCHITRIKSNKGGLRVYIYLFSICLSCVLQSPAPFLSFLSRLLSFLASWNWIFLCILHKPSTIGGVGVRQLCSTWSGFISWPPPWRCVGHKAQAQLHDA